VEGVFAGGEIHDNYFRQAITASGQGASAALAAVNWLGERERDLQDLSTEAQVATSGD
jgi:thioredoxin reductase (NADPH)